MTRQELKKKLVEINLRKNASSKKEYYEEAARLRDIEKCIFKILEDPLLNEAEVKVNAINRERQMLSILEDIEYVPYTVKETEEYKKLLEKDAYRVAKEELR